MKFHGRIQNQKNTNASKCKVNYLLNKITPSIELTEITVKDNEEKIEID